MFRRGSVIRHVRPRVVCRACEQIRQAPAVDLPLPKVMASSAMLAHLIVSRFVDHQPWHCQSVILRRFGLDIDRDVMSRWARKLAWLLAPLGERLFALYPRGLQDPRRRHAGPRYWTVVMAAGPGTSGFICAMIGRAAT